MTHFPLVNYVGLIEDKLTPKEEEMLARVVAKLKGLKVKSPLVIREKHGKNRDAFERNFLFVPLYHPKSGNLTLSNGRVEVTCLKARFGKKSPTAFRLDLANPIKEWK